MTGVQLFEALNPEPEIQGNPGPPASAGKQWSRRLKATWIIAAAAAIIIVAAIGIGRANRTPTSPVEVGVATQPNETETPDTPTIDDAEPAPGDSAPATSASEPERGAPRVIARLIIPRIESDLLVVDDVSFSALQRGPGHDPSTPLPGQAGNVVIAGNRTTFGAPFSRIDELAPGDEISIVTLQGTHEYRVTGTSIVEPSDVSVLEYVGDSRLTLTSSHPKFSQAQRIVVVAELVGPPKPTVTFDLLPALAQSSAPLIPGAPDISDEALRSGKQPYFSFVGSQDPLESAQTFLFTQFPEWAPHVELAVYQQTERVVSIRWSDVASETSGWIVLFFGDGVFHVFDMTTDGFSIDFFPTATGARAIAQANRPVMMRVMRPIPHSMTEGRPVGEPNPRADTPWVTAQVRQDSVGQRVDLGFAVRQSGEDHFQEVRVMLSDESGVQFGAATASLSNSVLLEPIRVITHVDETPALVNFLDANQRNVLDVVRLDRWQSADVLRYIDESLVPTDPTAIPQYHVTLLVPFSATPNAPSGGDTNFLQDLGNFGEVVTSVDFPDAVEVPVREQLQSVYVVDALPTVAQCAVAGAGGAPSIITANPDPQVFATAEEAVASAPPTSADVAVARSEFRDSGGTLLGVADAPLDRRYTFLYVIAVERSVDGWVLDRWESTPC